MTIKTKLAAVAVLSVVGTSAYAGDLSPAGTQDDAIIVIPEAVAGVSSGGSLGSLGSLGGVAVPAVLGLLILGAVASGGGT